MDVLCVGHAAWDISVFVDEYPVENSKCEIRTMLECGGGPAANAAFLLARWGIACGIATQVGADDYGRRIFDEFRDAKADVSLLVQSPDVPTPVSVILVNQTNGSRTIINRKAAGHSMRLHCPTVAIEPPKVLLFDGHELAASLEAMALFPNAKTILDAGSVREGTLELAPRVDYLVSSERFARQWCDLPALDSEEIQAKAVAMLYQRNGRPVAITCGERGVLFGTSERFERVPAFQVDAVDTTGAGDIFHGAFAYGILTEMGRHESLRLASATAALSVTQRGGRTSIPSLPQVREFLHHA